MDGLVVFFDNYTPVGDILVLATVFVLFALIYTSNISNTANYRTFKRIIVLVGLSAAIDIVYHIGMTFMVWSHPVLYGLRLLYHMSLFGSLFLYPIYISQTLHLGAKERRPPICAGIIGLIAIFLYDTLFSALGIGFVIHDDNTVTSEPLFFPIIYIYFVSILVVMFVRHNNRIYQRIVRGILISAAVSLVVMMLQGMNHQTSFTAFTFLFPIMAVLYLVHSNPFDFELGAINASAFEDMIAHNMRNKNELFLMSLKLPEYERSGNRYPEGIRKVIRSFTGEYMRNSLLFQLSTGHLILVFETKKNPGYESLLEKIKEQFYVAYDEFQLDFKAVFAITYPEKEPDLDYLQFIKYVSDRMPLNEFKMTDENDVKAFKEHQYIVSELTDIHEKKNLNDPRVLVYCQPVLNTRTGKYDTAEALMRLKLEKTGMVFPDRFIPIAEKHNFIHTLSLIILSKVCKDIRSMLDAGYEMQRVSVNFSAIDLREPDFCESVKNIISSSGIPFEMIAIEITESQSERDFMLMKKTVEKLRDTGIKFYLDDFGTGYSNFERIMEVPFDIIKFDRSLTTASGIDAKSETMVQYLARLFTDVAFSVLYEGVETDDDEQRCLNMCARYLQGYKYSKPIPFDELRNYFEKKAS